jgi:hypothetical protein
MNLLVGWVRAARGGKQSIQGIPASYTFTGQIDKVAIDVKEMEKADKAAEDKGRAEAAHKKAMSD